MLNFPVAWSLVLLVALKALTIPVLAAEATPEELEFFEKKVRPVLVERCHKCHSTQSEKLKGGLLLDSWEGLVKGGDAGSVIIPGDPEKSRLIEAIHYENVDLQMPPKGKLIETQIADFTHWVKMGAPWPKNEQGTKSAKDAAFDLEQRKREHWAWQPIQRPQPPQLKSHISMARPIDRFIVAQLEANGLKPAPLADRRTLIRRVYFDLIGLPPATPEVEEFLNDPSPEAYEKVVERLLASPAFGERWARHWLDLVRYAETLGHEFDYPNHNVWRYRDYVIRAFNSDVPYDQFVTEHIAGDLLASPRRQPASGFNESIIATGFFWLGQRDHSPVDVRQHQAELIDNQIDVMTKTFLGLTVACARCHDHKFDAISTRDFYSLYGILENSRYAQRSIDPPESVAPKIERLKSLKKQIRGVLGVVWETQASQIREYLLAAREATRGEAKDSDRVANGLNLDARRLERWVRAFQDPHADQPNHPMYAWVKWPAGSTGSEANLDRAKADLAESKDTIRKENSSMVFADFRGPDFAGWYADGDAFGTTPSPVGDFNFGDTNKPVVSLACNPCVTSAALSRRLQGALRSPTFTITHPYVHVLAAGRDSRINVFVDNLTIIRDPIYGGLRKVLNHDLLQWITIDLSMWKGHRAYLEFSDVSTSDPGDDSRKNGYGRDGYLTASRVVFSQDHSPPAERSESMAELIGQEKRDSLQALAARYQNLIVGTIQSWASCQTDQGDLGRAEMALLDWLVEKGLLDTAGREHPSSANDRLGALLQEYQQVQATLPDPRPVAAMTDGTGIDENVFVRGNHKTPGETVSRRFLEAIGGREQPAFRRGSGRLELAQRMTDPSNPFLSRVMVNRVWHHLFGRGLVPTPDDFGVLGQPPTHPELLDWLADWFRTEAGWSTKRLIWLLVTSHSYCMSSKPEDSMAEATDPDNLLLHRMAIRRLEGEAIRDSMLALSSQLDRSMFGPPVPIHLTEFMEGRGRPGNSGPLDGRGRRSIYLEVRRNFLSPMMRVFDSPVPFTTVGKRTVSNVPAQSLILMNDPFVIGQAQSWTKIVLADKELMPEQRVKEIYLTAFCRPPSQQELGEAIAFLNKQAETYGAGSESGLQDEKVWADLCHVLFNVKEFVFLN